jgi:hypothetical protein
MKPSRYFSVFILGLLILAVFPGCKSSGLKSLDFQITTREPDAVLSMFLIPRDSGGNIIAPDATLDVTLWEKTSVTLLVKGDVVGEWTGLPLGACNFDPKKGILLNLMPNDAFRGKSGQQAFIRLTLLSNKKTVFTTGIVITGDLPPCCNPAIGSYLKNEY